MKITNVEAFILESPYENRPPEGSDEAHGVKHCLLLKVSTDEGLVGWSDVETAPHVATAVATCGAVSTSDQPTRPSSVLTLSSRQCFTPCASSLPSGGRFS